MSLQTQIEKAQSPNKNRITDYHKALRSRIAATMAEPEQIQQEMLPALGKEFLSASGRGNPDTIKIFIEEGMDVNIQNPRTGQTPLHVAAANQARGAARVLLASRGCDFLVRDKHGRLPSEMAYMYGRDSALARLLAIKERKQAEQQGIKLTRRP